jgi:hypothetical protein
MLDALLLFAQVPEASPKQIGDWLVCLAAVLVITKLAKDLFVRKPSVEAEFARKEDLAKLAERFDDLQMERQRNLGELHEKINTVDRRLASIQGYLKKSQDREDR